MSEPQDTNKEQTIETTSLLESEETESGGWKALGNRLECLQQQLDYVQALVEAEVSPSPDTLRELKSNLQLCTEDIRANREELRRGWEALTARRAAGEERSEPALTQALKHEAAEEALRHSESRYRQLFQSNLAGVYLTKPDGSILDFNDSMQAMLGFESRDELYQHRSTDFYVDPDLRDELVGLLRRDGKVPGREAELRRRDGRILHALGSAVMLKDEISGEPFILGFAVDITARRRAEEALLESEERLRRILSHIHDALMMDDAEGRVIFANDRFLELFGFQRAELPGIRLEDYVAPECRRELRDRHDRRFRGEDTPTHFEYQGLRRDGRRLWLEVDVVAITGPDGKVTGTQSAIRDVTDRKRAEASLRESEERFRQAFEHAPIGMAIGDMQGHFLHVNQALCEITGYRREELLAPDFDFLRITHPDDREYNRQSYQRLVAGEVPAFFMEVRFQHKDGRTVWVRASASLRRGHDGRGDQIVGLIENIDDRKRAEAQLQRAHEETRDILESVSDAFVALDADWRFTYVNRKAEYFLQQSAGQLLGRTLWEAAPMLLGTPWEEHARTVMRERVPVHPEIRGVIHPEAWYEGAAYPHPDGGITVFFRDITDRKRAEEALSRSEAFLRNVIDTTPSMVFAKDWEGRFVLGNKAVARCYGTTPDGILGRTDADFNPNTEEIERFLHDDREVMANRHDKFIPEEPVTCADGITRWFSTVKIPLFNDDGTCDKILGVATDITERKQAEEIIHSSLRDKETLLKEIHHRIKNNLQIVSALLGLQANALKGRDCRRALEDSQSRVKSIALVHEKLYRSDDLRSIDFSDYLQTLALSMNRTYSLDQRGIVLRVEADPVPLDIDTALPCSLVVNELVTNALKYAFPEGGKGGTVQVSLKAEEGRLRLAVADDGQGLPPDLDFHHPPTLGLQLVNSLTGQLGAELTVQTRPGTRVELMIPEKR